MNSNREYEKEKKNQVTDDNSEFYKKKQRRAFVFLLACVSVCLTKGCSKNTKELPLLCLFRVLHGETKRALSLDRKSVV